MNDLIIKRLIDYAEKDISLPNHCLTYLFEDASISKWAIYELINLFMCYPYESVDNIVYMCLMKMDYCFMAANDIGIASRFLTAKGVINSISTILLKEGMR